MTKMTVKNEPAILSPRIIRSNRKTISIEIQSDLSLVVRAPKFASQNQIDSFLDEKKDWILRAIEKMRMKKAEYEASDAVLLTYEEIQKLADQALQYIPKRVRYYAGIVGVDYGRITIRNQRTRWGSCSSQGNLNFNCMLILAPKEVIDYVVVHELCHRKEMNHSKAFWEEVEKVLPEYKTYLKWLKSEGVHIIRRMQ